PTIDVNGNVSNRVVKPDLASTDGKLAEIRVPEDARTGPIQVVGAAGTFQLQIVPTLKLAERYSSTDVRLLGSGFTENSNLTVKFGATPVPDTGPTVDVAYNFFINDLIYVGQPSGSGNVVTVTTAGGTSPPV